MTTTTRKQDDPRDCATAWFCELELARERGDIAGAAEALRELLRLGVKIEFTDPTLSTKEGH